MNRQDPPQPPCPTCGEPVESYEHRPGYVMSADLVPGTAIPISGTERRVRVPYAQGPEFTLLPCGHQLRRMELRAVDDVVVEIREAAF
jgi:hypothetical protein